MDQTTLKMYTSERMKLKWILRNRMRGCELYSPGCRQDRGGMKW